MPLLHPIDAARISIAIRDTAARQLSLQGLHGSQAFEGEAPGPVAVRWRAPRGLLSNYPLEPSGSASTKWALALPG